MRTVNGGDTATETANEWINREWQSFQQIGR